MPDYETLLWEQHDCVATVTLNRPALRNAMSWTMFGELEDAFRRAGEDGDVRCLVVTGAGGAFCSGADLSDPANLVGTVLEMRDRLAAIGRIAATIATCPTPTIAKVTGVAAGAGCNLALACDLIVASTEARFAELFVKRGLVVDFGGTWALARALPIHKAKELALLGEIISAAEAHELGLVNRLCAPEEVDAVTADMAARLAALPPRTLALMKENLNRAAERSLEDNLQAEERAQAMLRSSEDTMEAITAFVEKREPRFTGR